MPEGHTIHRAARDQRPKLVGQTLDVSSPQGWFSEGAAHLDGQLCTGIETYGKHLLYEFSNQITLHIHLGLFGRFRVAKRPAAEPRGAVRIRMISQSHVVDINGPNTCELLDQAGTAALVNRIGPDVLRADADPERAWDKISRSKSSIGKLLMDQSVMAGIGNIYRTELLWRQKLHPDVPGHRITREIFDGLWKDAVDLLRIGEKNNAIITVTGMKKSTSRYGERVNIFKKPKCPSCKNDIRAIEIATRKAYVCDVCQNNPANPRANP